MKRQEGAKKASILTLAKRLFAGFVFACVLVVTGYAGFARVNAAVSPPRIIMYQGRLLNSNNVPVSDATASISFALYSAASGGTCLWSNNDSGCASVVPRTVTLTSGLFSEPLGDGTATPAYATIASTVFTDNGNVFLEVIVNGETLAPRKQMLAAPYAVNSDALDGLDTSSIGATTSVVPVTNANGNLIITGSPTGAGVDDGSVSINPAAGVVAANETLFGVSVDGSMRFVVDGEGDVLSSGDFGVNGGDLTSTASAFNFLNANVTTLSMAGAATVIDFNNAAVTSSINIGGTSQNGANTIGIATNNASADVITIGNNHAATTTEITGGASWSMTAAGLLTTSNDVAVNGGDITSTSVGFNMLDAVGNSSTIDIGGVTTDLANTINIATNNTTGDAIVIGNNNAGSTMGLVGGASWSIAATGLMTTSNDVAINGGDLTSTSTAFNLLNTNVTTLTMASAATVIDFNNSAVSSSINIGGTSQNGANTIGIATNSTSADAITMGNNNAATTVAITGGTNWSIGTNGKIVTAHDISVDGGDITSSSVEFNFLDTSGDSATIDIGGVTTNLANTINIATNNTLGDTIVIGNTNAGSTMSLVGGTSWSIATTGLVTTSNDVAINGGDLTSTSSAFNLLNTNVTTLAMAGESTVIDFNNSAVTSSINIGGTSQNGANTIGIATNNTSADSITMGNNNAATTVAITGGTNWSIASTGLFTTAGDVAVNGNDITSTGILRIASGGAAALSLDSSSGLVYTATADDFAVGATSLAAPFSVDESANTIRIGDGANDANEPALSFYASDAVNSGTLAFTDADTFAFTGGKLTETFAYDLSTLGTGGYTTLTSTSTVTGTSGAAVNQTLTANNGTITYSGALGGGSSAAVVGSSGTVNIGNTNAVLSQAFGAYGNVYNQSTNATAVNGAGYLAGGDFSVYHDSTQTITLAYGAYAYLTAGQGTVSNGTAVMGEVKAGGGAFTTGYGGQFSNINEGGTRYGILAEASGGGTANYAGYFSGARLQVDADRTPDTPGTANGAGDVYIADDIEADGKARFGDTTGSDDVIITSAITTTSVTQINVASLTSGTGLMITRVDDGGAGVFSGKLIDLQMQDTSSSTGIGINVSNQVGGNSLAAYFNQTNVANQTDAAGGTTIGGQALVLETPEAGSNDDMMLIRSNGQIVLAIETDGSVLSDNAYSAAGADYAEYFPSTDSTLAFYEMICVDSARPLSVKRCGVGEQDPFGVMSSDPGFIGNLPRAGETGNVLVGMVGQIETFVNANEGAIAIGDPITTSTVTAGYGAKARGPARIIGFALEPLSAGTGTITVLVQPQWYAGNVFTHDGSATKVTGSLAIAALTSATSASAAVNSADLQFRGSVWSGGVATSRAMSLNTTVTASNEYRLSVKNTAGLEVASVNQSGDLALAGKFYPSDRGAIQGSAYIYFDGSAGLGGSFMRTNASGWATGSYDFAEMFPSPDVLQPGEIVVFGDASQQVKRSTGETYSQAIAGIVSTRPGFLAGENRPGTYPIALAGRVPTFVSTENGNIDIGDPLTTSSVPGVAMRATEAGPIIGYASEPFAGATGSIVVFVNVSYYAGTPVEEGPATANTISHLAQDIENFDTAGVLNLNGGQLLAVGAMSSASGAWRLDTNGDIVTSGRLVQLVESSSGANIETYAATSREMTVQLSGTVELNHGRAMVRFADIDPAFTSIIDERPSYRALVTPYGATGSLYVTGRTADGFEIVESGDATSGVDVDWIVIAYRRDFAPVVTETVVSEPQPIIVPPVPESTEATAPVAVSEPEVLVPVEEDAPVTPVEDTVPVLEVEAPAPTEVIEAPIVEVPVSTGDGDVGTTPVEAP